MSGHAPPPEIDLDKGAQRLGMDRKRLETMLPNFLRDNEDIPRRVREAREAGDYLAVQGWVHKIAGAYLYLGADTLRARARALQDTLGDEGI